MKKYALALSLAWTTGLCYSHVQADDNAEAWTLPEMVVTASRSPRDSMTEPWSIHSIDAVEASARLGIRTTADILKGLPSVMLQKTSNAQTSPYIRGFTGYRTLALIDGIRLNHAAFRSGPNQYWNTIDPYSIDTYELVLGPGSVLYGSDAVGGVLNALTLTPPRWTGEPAWDSHVRYRASDAENSHVGRLQTAIRPNERWGMTGGFTYKHFGDVRGGKQVGRQKRTGYDEFGFDGKMQYAISEDALLTVAHQSVRQEDAWRTHRTVYGAIHWRGLTHGSDLIHRFDQSRDLTYVRLDSDPALAGIDRFQITFSRHMHQEDGEVLRQDLRKTLDGFDVEALGGNVQMESSHIWGTLVYGADFYRDNVSSYAREYQDDEFTRIKLQGPVAGSARYDMGGFFAQNTTSLMNGFADLVLGLRYTHVQADARQVEDPATGNPIALKETWDATTGSVRLLLPVTVDRQHVVFAGITQSFRAPSIHDLTSFGIARSDEIEIPAPDLDTENFVTYELGWKSRTRAWRFQASYYYTDIDGLIVKTPTGAQREGFREVTKSNASDGYVHGVEGSLYWTGHPQWSAWIRGSWQEGRVDVLMDADGHDWRRDYISRIMPPTAQCGIRWQTQDGTYWVEAVGDFAAKANRLSEGDRLDSQRIPEGGTPGYAIPTLRIGTVTRFGLVLAASLENILNEDYRIHGSGLNEPGRNLILTAQHNF